MEYFIVQLDLCLHFMWLNHKYYTVDPSDNNDTEVRKIIPNGEKRGYLFYLVTTIVVIFYMLLHNFHSQYRFTIFNSSLTSGIYKLRNNISLEQYDVYCHMTELSGCGQGPWTLVLKVNGTKVSDIASWKKNPRVFGM